MSELYEDDDLTNIHYKPDLEGDAIYSFSYPALKERFEFFNGLGDDDFIAEGYEVIHFAIFVSWLKGCGQEALSDTGIVHELVHLFSGAYDEEDDYGERVESIRSLFYESLHLS